MGGCLAAGENSGANAWVESQTLATGEANHSGRSWKTLWGISIGIVVAANAADLYSSRGGYETNPLLRSADGRFNLGSGVALKSAISGSLLATQFLLRRSSHGEKRDKAFALINLGTAAPVVWAARHNTSTR
jgi:hypothetical protein